MYLTLRKTYEKPLKIFEMQCMILRKSLQKTLNLTEMRCLKYSRLNIDYLYQMNKVSKLLLRSLKVTRVYVQNIVLLLLTDDV